MSFITIVIPTLNRDTLNNAIYSVRNLIDSDWELLVMIDKGEKSAGLVRNRAIELIKSPWTGFLDDDDRLHPDYIREVKIANDEGFDVVVFAMQHASGKILRPDAILHGHVGIAFAMKTELFRQFPFSSTLSEDVIMLFNLQNAGKKIKMCDKVMYYVRPDE